MRTPVSRKQSALISCPRSAVATRREVAHRFRDLDSLLPGSWRVYDAVQFGLSELLRVVCVLVNACEGTADVRESLGGIFAVVSGVDRRRVGSTSTITFPTGSNMRKNGWARTRWPTTSARRPVRVVHLAGEEPRVDVGSGTEEVGSDAP